MGKGGVRTAAYVDAGREMLGKGNLYLPARRRRREAIEHYEGSHSRGVQKWKLSLFWCKT